MAFAQLIWQSVEAPGIGHHLNAGYQKGGDLHFATMCGDRGQGWNYHSPRYGDQALVW